MTAVTRRVFLHIGLPKTGTTYLQSILWEHRDALRDAGLLLPGQRSRSTSGPVATFAARRGSNGAADAPGSWGRLAAEITDWPQDALITHEFFCGASADQIGAALDRLEGAEVHVVLTAREIVSLVTARWQEWVKNGATGAIDDYPTQRGLRPHGRVGLGHARPGRHPRSAGRPTYPPSGSTSSARPAPGRQRRALGALRRRARGRPGRRSTLGARPNRSLGLVAIELMRRVNAHADVRRPVDRGVWLRGYLAEEVLADLDERAVLALAARVAALRERGRSRPSRLGRRRIRRARRPGVLETPEPLEPRRHPAEVADAEVADVAAQAMARMLGDVREARTDSPTRARGAAERFVTLARRARRRRTRG